MPQKTALTLCGPFPAATAQGLRIALIYGASHFPHGHLVLKPLANDSVEPEMQREITWRQSPPCAPNIRVEVTIGSECANFNITIVNPVVVNS